MEFNTKTRTWQPEEAGEETPDYLPPIRGTSTVPLADGSMPKPVPAVAFQGKMEVDELKRAQELEQIMRMEKEMKAAAEYKKAAIPTPSQVAAETARSIGQKEAEKARQRAARSATQQMQDDIAARKALPVKTMPNHAENCRIMNSYRDAYEGKVNFKFRKDYTTDLDPDKVVAEKVQLELLLGGREAPKFLKDLIMFTTQTLERVSVGLSPDYNLYGVTEDLTNAMAEGYLTDEIREVSIKFLPWFSLSAEARLMIGLAMIFGKRLGVNSGMIPADQEVLSHAEGL
jgi:hypothetical protein